MLSEKDTLDPRLVMMSKNRWISAISGTLVRRTFFTRSAAARMGSAAFFDPEMVTSPEVVCHHCIVSID